MMKRKVTRVGRGGWGIGGGWADKRMRRLGGDSIGYMDASEVAPAKPGVPKDALDISPKCLTVDWDANRWKALASYE